MLANRRLLYKRPNNRHTHTKGVLQFTYNNCYVATYNYYFSVHFNIHVNVKSCQGYLSVKYVYKYIYKGSNCATASLAVAEQQQLDGVCQSPVDKIKEYVNALYVSYYKTL